MYRVYVQYYKQADGTINTSNTPLLMLQVPSTDYKDTGYPIENPIVKSSEDMADSFDFQMEVDSPFYNSLIHMKTLIRVDYNNTTIFFGRVLTISTSTVFQSKRVHCEGAYAFFKDSLYEGKDQKDRKKISWSTFYDRIIENHNNYINKTGDPNAEPWKVFTRGVVTIDGTNDFTPTTTDDTFEPESWTQSLSLFSNLTGEFGGHMRARYVSGDLYLDWYKYYLRDSENELMGIKRPSVTVGKNILDMSSDSNVDNVYTRLIPIGSNTKSNGEKLYVNGYKYTDINGDEHTNTEKYISVSIIPDIFRRNQIRDEFHDVEDYTNAEDNYGIIYKTMQFDDALRQDQLWEKATKWMKDSYFGIATSFSIKAIDMAIIGNSQYAPIIMIGDCVDLTFVAMENGETVKKYDKLVCKSVSYDLFNPDNNSYTLGIPTDVLKKNTAQRKSSKASDQIANPPKPKGDKDDGPTVVTFDAIANTIWYADPATYGPYAGRAARDSFLTNGRMDGTVTVYDVEEYPRGPAAVVFDWSWIKFTAILVGKITPAGAPMRYVGFNNRKGVFYFLPTRDSDANAYPIPANGWYIKNYVEGKQIYETEQPYVVEQSEDGKSKDVSFGPGKNIKLDDGEIAVGKNESTGDYSIVLNTPITYEDEEGHTQTIPDGVKLGDLQLIDLHLRDFPSFRTKIAQIDTAIINRATIRELETERARINELYATRITVDELTARHQIDAGALSATHYRLWTGLESEEYYLDDAITKANITYDDQTELYTLHLYRVKGTEVSPIPGGTLSFNRAAPTSTNKISGSWSGMSYLIAANPNGKSLPVYLNISADYETESIQGQTIHYLVISGQATGDISPTVISKKTLNLKNTLDTSTGIRTITFRYGTEDTNLTCEVSDYNTGRQSVTPGISWNTLTSEQTIYNQYDRSKDIVVTFSTDHETQSASGTTIHYIRFLRQAASEQQPTVFMQKTISIDSGSISGSSRTIKVRYNNEDILSYVCNDYGTGKRAATLEGSWSGDTFTARNDANANNTISTSVSLDIVPPTQTTPAYSIAAYGSVAGNPASVVSSKAISLVASNIVSGIRTISFRFGTTTTNLTYECNDYITGRNAATLSDSWTNSNGNAVHTICNAYNSNKNIVTTISAGYESYNNINYFTVYARNSDESTATARLRKTLTINEGSVSSGSRTVKFRIANTDALSYTCNDYRDAWNRALNDCTLLTASSPLTDSVIASWPNTSINGDARTRTYTISVTNDYAYLRRTDSGSTTAILRCPNTAYTNGYDAGWKAYYDDWDWPNRNLSSDRLTFTFGGSTPNADAVSRTYSLSVDDDYCYLMWNNSRQIRCQNDAYAHGWLAYFNDWDWPDPGTAASMTVSLPGGSPDSGNMSKTFTLTKEGNYIRLKDGSDVYAQLQITIPTGSDILLGSVRFDVTKPSDIPSYTDFDALRTAMKNYSRGYVFFKASLSNGTGYKWYRMATLT